MARKKSHFTPRDLGCAKWIFSLVKELNPYAKKPNFNAWAHDVRLMREQDGRTYQQIHDVFVWANGHEFWQVHCLSTRKLRKQFDVITAQMPKPEEQKKPKNNVRYEYDFSTKTEVDEREKAPLPPEFYEMKKKLRG